MQNLSPEQIAQAKAVGLIPVDAVVRSHQNIESHVAKPHVSGDQASWKKDWHDPSCDIRCPKTDVTVPPLIMISLDGFAAEYLQRKIMTTFDRMEECGTRAEFMYPSFPSKTFPNHYTMATGLYPEAHGIVDNTIFDPLVEPELVDAKRTNNSKFYLGEPIWSAVERNGKKAACLFWPGCGVQREFMPTYNHKYNKSFSYSERVDTIIKWLKLPVQQRPDLIMAYFDQPDSVGHYHKTDEEVNKELVHMEGLLNYFFSTLYSLQWLDCVNIVIVSDHGMHTLQNRYYFSDLMDTSGLIISSGVIGRIHLADSGRTYESVAKRFECDNKGQLFRLYNRTTMPVRFHYSATPRVGDLIFEGRPGTTFFQSHEHDTQVTSDHGFDYLDDSMHAIFFGRGPNIQRGKKLDPFQNVELVHFMLDLLQLPHDVPSNGTFGLLHKAILNVNSVNPPLVPPLHLLGECPEKVLFVKREFVPCDESSECKQSAKTLNSKLDHCTTSRGPYGVFHSENAQFCLTTMCGTSLLSRGMESGKGDASMMYESLSSQQLNSSKSTSAGRCDFYLRSFESDCKSALIAQNRSLDLIYKNVAVDDSNELMNFHQTKSALYHSFFSGGFSILQNLTRGYVHKYNRIVSISGTIYDLDTNGLVDTFEVFQRAQKLSGQSPPPTYVFRILLRCEDSLWQIDGHSCQNPEMTRVLSFILPNLPRDPNCLSDTDYLMANSARVKDIELLTSVEFFTQRQLYTEELALLLRAHIPQVFW